ncbi:MAG: polyprenyl synthetase family protein [Actinomycetota bacterium]
MKPYPIPQRIAIDLERVETALSGILNAYPGQLREPAGYTVEAGGKRLRPVLTLIAGQAGIYDYDKLEPVALSTELLHTATLVHDDVLDEAGLRRGRETVNARWGEKTAVATGNMLLTEAFTALCDKSEPFVMKGMTDCAALLSEGELMQQRALRHTALSIEEYNRRVCYKTAALFAACCEFGARVSGAGMADIKALKQYGECLGMAFQVFDDILDVTADEAKLGKPVGGDIRDGTVTLPVIYALARKHSQRLKEIIQTAGPLDDETVNEAIEIIKDSGGVDQARAEARDYLDRAFLGIENISKKALKVELTAIGEFVIDRYN